MIFPHDARPEQKPHHLALPSSHPNRITHPLSLRPIMCDFITLHFRCGHEILAIHHCTVLGQSLNMCVTGQRDLDIEVPPEKDWYYGELCGERRRWEGVRECK